MGGGHEGARQTETDGQLNQEKHSVHQTSELESELRPLLRLHRGLRERRQPLRRRICAISRRFACETCSQTHVTLTWGPIWWHVCVVQCSASGGVVTLGHKGSESHHAEVVGLLLGRRRHHELVQEDSGRPNQCHRKHFKLFSCKILEEMCFDFEISPA